MQVIIKSKITKKNYSQKLGRVHYTGYEWVKHNEDCFIMQSLLKYN